MPTATVPARVGSATLFGVSRPVNVPSDGRSVPNLLCVDQNRDAVLEFRAELRAGIDKNIPGMISRQKSPPRRSPSPTIRNYYDFTRIKWISPAVALMVAAEFDRLFAITGLRSPALDLDKWNPNVTQTLRQLGFFELLDIEAQSEQPTRVGVRILKFRAGNLADNQPGKMIDELEEVAAELLPNANIDFGRLYTAMMEGIINSREHAYPVGKPFVERERRWWATATLDAHERRISAIIYDQGVSIPASLPSSRLWDQILHLFPFMDKAASEDGAAIAAAIEVCRTSTGKPNRGKGLAEMEAFMRTSRGGRLRILSRNGEYVAGVDGTPKAISHKLPVRGTLVEWEVSVAGALD